MDIDYQDIVKSYKNNAIDTSSLKKGLEVAKPLVDIELFDFLAKMRVFI